MKTLLLTCSLLFSSALLVSCSSTQTAPSNNAQACNAGIVKITTDFSTGRMDECTLVTKNEYLITLIPENTPINSSPWYAFKVQAEQARDITITMQVRGDKHRYPPKVSRDGKYWQLQPYQLEEGSLTMEISATAEPLWIAAQEVVNNKDYIEWGNDLAGEKHISHDILGWSEQERPLFKVESKAESNEWLVVLGRQHPPEVTGALALFPFAETLLGNSELAQEFRQRFNILVVPNLNPDGVYMGNWRHNANGVDLNRDWKSFVQAEVKAVNDYLIKLTDKQQKLMMAVDFHSTHKDIFYTMPSDYGVENPMLVEQWLTTLDKQYPDFDVIQKPGNNPGKGVFKQYFSDVFNVHAITYEMGDNTDRVFINQLAESAANSLMKALLATPELATSEQNSQ